MTREELLLCCKDTKEGVIISCHVRPGASKTRCAGLYGESMKLSLKAPPVDGKANECLLLYFAEKLHIPKGSVSLLSGQTSREKRVGITNVTPEKFITVFAGED